MKPSLKNFLNFLLFLILLTLIYYSNFQLFQGTVSFCMQRADEIEEKENLTQELLTYGIDFLNPFLQENQNGTHAFRFYVRQITKTKSCMITPAEYNRLLNLSKKHTLGLKLNLSS
jgi:hypothetical protein